MEAYKTIGNIIDQQGLSSWTTDAKIASGFGAKDGRGIVFVQNGGTELGRKLSDTFKQTDIEKEVIVSSKAKQEIMKIEEEKYYTKVYVKELK